MVGDELNGFVKGTLKNVVSKRYYKESWGVFWIVISTKNIKTSNSRTGFCNKMVSTAFGNPK